MEVARDSSPKFARKPAASDATFGAGALAPANAWDLGPFRGVGVMGA